LFTGGGVDQLLSQIVPAFTVLAYSFGVAYVVAKVIDRTVGFRIEPDEEVAGIDSVLHGEEGYALT